MPRPWPICRAHIEGVDEIEVLVIDDGSTDGTARARRRARGPPHRPLPGEPRARVARSWPASTRRSGSAPTSSSTPTPTTSTTGPTSRASWRRSSRGAPTSSSATGRPTRSRTSRCSRRSCSAGARVSCARLSGDRRAPTPPSGFRAISRKAALGSSCTTASPTRSRRSSRRAELGLVVRTTSPSRPTPTRASRASSADPPVPAPRRPGHRSAPTRCTGRVELRSRVASVLLVAARSSSGASSILYLRDPARSGHTQSLDRRGRRASSSRSSSGSSRCSPSCSLRTAA